jgi:outer membrane receptor for ferrienterochelin and colicins
MKSCLALFSALGLCSWASASRAQDTSELEGLLDESVVSTASKTAEVTSTAPATSVSISADEIRRYGIRTIDEAINYLAMGMQIEKSDYAAEIGARGVLLSGDVGAHVLLLVDGHAVNEQWGAAAYYDRGMGVPMEMVDHIEIVLGPGSVLYGSNAMLGTVNVVTKWGKDFSGAHLVLESELPINLRAALGYGRQFQLLGHEAEVVFELEHFVQQGPTLDYPLVTAEPDSVTGLARPYSADQPAGVWGGPGDDALRVQDTGGYLHLRSGGLEVGLRGMLYRRSHPADSGNFDDPSSFVRDRWLSADIKYQAAMGEMLRASLRLYGDHYDFRQDWPSNGAADCLEGQDSGCMWRLYGHAEWAGLEPQLSFDWLRNRSLVTLLGVDGRIKRVGSNVNYIDFVTGTSPGPVGAFEKSEHSLGAYLQTTFWPVDFVGLNLGARWDGDSRFGSKLSPRAAVTFVPWSRAAFKLIYAEAFRAPTAWDVYYTDPRSQLAGGHDLQPEHVRSVETSFEQRWGTQRLIVGAFQSWWQDLVLLEDLDDEELAAGIASGELLPDTAEASQLRNVSAVRSYGFNAGYYGSLAAGSLRYGLSVTRAMSRASEPGSSADVLPVAAPTLGNARVAYTLPGTLPTLALAGRYVSQRPIDEYTPDNPRFTPAQVELRLTLSGDLPIAGLSYRLTANYTTSTLGPYAVGPIPADDALRPYIPIERFRTGIGLQYDFWQ